MGVDKRWKPLGPSTPVSLDDDEDTQRDRTSGTVKMVRNPGGTVMLVASRHALGQMNISGRTNHHNSERDARTTLAHQHEAVNGDPAPE